jgi:hypothetical protein
MADDGAPHVIEVDIRIFIHRDRKIFTPSCQKMFENFDCMRMSWLLRDQ